MKLISLNIEGHFHLAERTIPFLLAEQPDVVCLQEVFAVDVPHLKHTLGMDGLFVPIATVDQVSIHQKHALGEWGVAIFSRIPGTTFDAATYVTKPGKPVLPIFFDQDDPNSMNRVAVWATVPAEDEAAEDEAETNMPYTIATTHFTWSPKGSYTEEQATTLQDLLAVTQKLPPHILCGDFNSPRVVGENNAFTQLAKIYTDNIPPEVTTSLDGQWHKAGQLELMVDGLFSSPEYLVENVKVVGGVSDHKALVADVRL